MPDQLRFHCWHQLCGAITPYGPHCSCSLAIVAGSRACASALRRACNAAAPAPFRLDSLATGRPTDGQTCRRMFVRRKDSAVVYTPVAPLPPCGFSAVTKCSLSVFLHILIMTFITESSLQIIHYILFITLMFFTKYCDLATRFFVKTSTSSGPFQLWSRLIVTGLGGTGIGRHRAGAWR